MFLKIINKVFCLILISLVLLSCNKKNDNNLYFETFIFNQSKNIPIIKFNTNDKSYINLIIDTGSEINIIDENYYNENKKDFILIDSINNTINTVSGNINKTTYIVSTTLNDSIYIEFYVLDINKIVNDIYLNQQILTNGLLGINFMYEHNMNINFKNKKIELQK